MKMFFAPNGTPIVRISACSFESPDVSIEDGKGCLDAFSDFPDFDPITAPLLGNLLLDTDGDEWLEQHCRLIETADEFDAWGLDAVDELMWDADIIDACWRVAQLGGALWAADKLRNWMPADMCRDPTISAALDTIIVGRARGEIDELQAKIAAYRKSRVEPATLIEPEPADEIEEALGLMRGGERG